MSTYGYLFHHGIKGQKWGIRRFQNPDGSLTAEGLKRYGYTMTKPKKNISKLSDDKKLKIAKKQYTKDLHRAGAWNTDQVMEDFTRLRENDDLKKWGNNKEFKADMKKAYQKYVDYEKKGGYGPTYQKELLAPLYNKYPKAKNILDGMSFWEASEDPFGSKEQTWLENDPSEFIHWNWIRDLWNNDYYYETSQEDIDKAYNIVKKAAISAMNDEYATFYGKDIVNKMLSEKPSEKSKKSGKKVAAGVLSTVGPLAVAAVIGGGYLLTKNKGKNAAPSMEEISEKIKESLN